MEGSQSNPASELSATGVLVINRGIKNQPLFPLLVLTFLPSSLQLKSLDMHISAYGVHPHPLLNKVWLALLETFFPFYRTSSLARESYKIKSDKFLFTNVFSHHLPLLVPVNSGIISEFLPISGLTAARHWASCLPPCQALVSTIKTPMLLYCGLM